MTKIRNLLKEIILRKLTEAKPKFRSDDPQHKYDMIAKLSGTRPQAVKDFIEGNNINAIRLMMDLGQQILKPMDFVSALVGTPGNRIQKQLIAKYTNK